MEMGIFIHILVSRSVTREEWQDVYQETLKLIEYFPLAECRNEVIRGIETVCLAASKERECLFDWNGKHAATGWCADGDMKTMKRGDTFFLGRDLVSDASYDACADDAILGAVSAYTSFGKGKKQRSDHIYHLWGKDTQGEPYHMYLLAVACLLESRLKSKAFVYGDITKGQCRKAVELANEILEAKIDIPDRCYLDKLYDRIKELNCPNAEKLEMFVSLYLGKHDEEYREMIRARFSETDQKEYWKKVFCGCGTDTLRFGSRINAYLESGADLSMLCDVIDFSENKGSGAYEDLIRSVLETKIHLAKKDLRDELRIDQDDEKPYSIWTMVAQHHFAGVCNRHVNGYIPVDEIRRTFLQTCSDKCNVNGIIDGYLEKEAAFTAVELREDSADQDVENACKKDVARALNDIMVLKQEQLKELYEKYDICDYEDLMYYKKGNSIYPGLLSSVKESFAFYDRFNDEKRYKKMMSKDALKRCKWLVKRNESIIIRKQNWEKIFFDIETSGDSFRRYYPMGRIRVTDRKITGFIKALILNDDFYAFCAGTGLDVT